MIPIIHRGPLPGSPEAQTRDALHVLRNVLEYSVKDDVHKLETLRALTNTYAKAISGTRKTEFYFPLKMWRTRDGAFLQILSVLKREDKALPIKWDAKTGLPLANAKLMDDMRDNAGKVWRYGFQLKSISKIFTVGRPGL